MHCDSSDIISAHGSMFKSPSHSSSLLHVLFASLHFTISSCFFSFEITRFIHSFIVCKSAIQSVPISLLTALSLPSKLHRLIQRHLFHFFDQMHRWAFPSFQINKLLQRRAANREQSRSSSNFLCPFDYRSKVPYCYRFYWEGAERIRNQNGIIFSRN